MRRKYQFQPNINSWMERNFPKRRKHRAAARNNDVSYRLQEVDLSATLESEERTEDKATSTTCTTSLNSMTENMNHSTTGNIMQHARHGRPRATGGAITLVKQLDLVSELHFHQKLPGVWARGQLRNTTKPWPRHGSCTNTTSSQCHDWPSIAPDVLRHLSLGHTRLQPPF
jgi:hypothetical protein